MHSFCKLLLIVVISISSPVWAIRERPERWYQNKWCDRNNGITEYQLPDKTRCDCLTTTHAVEFDFADKWAEAIGQALHYAMQTGRRPGIVLILENESDWRHWIRLNAVIQHYKLPLKTWKIEKSKSI